MPFRKFSALFMITGLLIVSGCASTRNRVSETPVVDPRVQSMQEELRSKDAEILRLETQLADSENEKRSLEDRLSSAMARAEVKTSSRPAPVNDPDLK